MRNPKAVVMLVLSVIIGLGATIVAAGWISQQGQVASTKVVVAAGDIQLGSRLNSQMLKTVDWPSGSIPPGAMTKAERWRIASSRRASSAASRSSKRSLLLSARKAACRP